MPLHETEAFVLRSYTLKEADKICVFLTRDAGKLRGVAHGARKLRSRFGSSLEPFTEVALTYFQKENRELVSLSNCEIIRSNFDLAARSEMLAATEYLAELVLEFLPDHEPNERVYRLIAATLESFRQAPADITPQSIDAQVRYFEVWLLRLAGFFPDLRRCGSCDKDLAREASVWLTAETTPQCLECSQRRGEELRPNVRQMIQVILQKSPKAFFASTHDHRALGQVKNITARQIQRVLERELKSYELLNRLKPEIEMSEIRD
ncbi:MAG TPA: DNA repair protein RecO [Blastocatellia bacterium]|nr:DNA repair protein RecO [Blastocatellia bacterium]